MMPSTIKGTYLLTSTFKLGKVRENGIRVNDVEPFQLTFCSLVTNRFSSFSKHERSTVVNAKKLFILSLKKRLNKLECFTAKNFL